jgi:hypothetical protein
MTKYDLGKEHADPRLDYPMPDKNIVNVSPEVALPFMVDGEFIGGHTMPWGSNYTFLMWISLNDTECFRVIYKPQSGEKPLRDFTVGSLYKREQAAYLISTTIGWPNIPLTIIRNGPYGIGSVQLYIDCDPRITYFDIRDDNYKELFSVSLFDLITNNADRKGGHLLMDDNNKIWSIDHGLTFHHIFKMRTVMFEYCGNKIPDTLLAELNDNNLISPIYDQLSELVSQTEIQSLEKRISAIINNPEMPILDPNFDIPWPIV